MNTSPKFIDVVVVGHGVKVETYRNRDPQIPRGHKDFIMSRGELHDFSTNPRKWLLGIPKKDTNATDWGSLIDCLALTPERFDNEYIVRPEKYKSEGMQCPYCKKIADSMKCKACGNAERVKVEVEKDWNENATVCSEWTEKQKKAGLTPVKKEDYDEAIKALEMIKADSRILDLINCSKTQMMIVATYVDRATGIKVPLKILLDLVPDKDHPVYGKCLADFKTARNAEQRAWETAVADGWYDAQAALYADIYRAAFPNEERWDFRHAIQENESPYITARRTLTEEFIHIGRAKYLNALKDYCICLATGVWPSYDDIPNQDTFNGWTATKPKEWMESIEYGLRLELPVSKEPAQPEERNDFNN